MFAEPVPSFANIRSARVAGGLGTVPQAGRRGAGHLFRPAAARRGASARIEAIYKPYHDALKRLLTAHPCALRLRRADRLPFDAGDHPRRRQRRAARTSSSATASAPRRAAALTEHGDRPADRRWATRSPTTSPMPAASSPSITAGRRAACTRCRSRSIAAST